MKRISLSFFFAVLSIIVLWGTCYSQGISSTDLINNSRQLDGKIILYSGEVIGEVMVRGESAWVNINDGANAIGVWMNKGLAGLIQLSGDYKNRGDWVEVTGTLQRVCPEHGGDLDIHASYLKKIRPGRHLNQRLNILKAYQALALLGILFLIWILSQLKYRPKPK